MRNNSDGAQRYGVLHLTEDYQLRRHESGTLVTNKGATGQVIVTLPPGENGTPTKGGEEFRFRVMEAQNLRIVPHEDSAIILDDSSGDAGAPIELDDVGQEITLVADDNGDWIALANAGFADSADSGDG